MRYTYDEHPPTVDAYAEAMVTQARALLPDGSRIIIEPGRSMVATSACTVYRVTTIKRGVVTHVAVDGGMGDNLEVSLTGQRFEATMVDRVGGGGETVSVVGRHCESGDQLVDGIALREPAVGDLLAVPVTGAYCYTMSNQYNGARRVPVVFARGAGPGWWFAGHLGRPVDPRCRLITGKINRMAELRRRSSNLPAATASPPNTRTGPAPRRRAGDHVVAVLAAARGAGHHRGRASGGAGRARPRLLERALPPTIVARADAESSFWVHVTHGDPVGLWIRLEDGRCPRRPASTGKPPPPDLDGRLVGEAHSSCPATCRWAITGCTFRPARSRPAHR